MIMVPESEDFTDQLFRIFITATLTHGGTMTTTTHFGPMILFGRIIVGIPGVTMPALIYL